MQRALLFFETLPNSVEWIIIDDCSTDDSYEQLKSYINKQKLHNVRLIQNIVNSGPGVSRNIGVNTAIGTYITFLDSDDFFTSDFWNTIYPELSKEHDCLIFDANLSYSNGSNKYLSMFERDTSEGNLSCSGYLLVYTQGCTWGKIYLRKIITDNNVCFLNQKRCEDEPFTKHALSLCKDVWYVKKPLYCYVQQPRSLMHDRSLANPVNARNSFLYLRKRLEDKFPIEVEALFIKLYLYQTILQSINNTPRSEYLKIVKQTELLYPSYYSNSYLHKESIRVRLVVFCGRNKLYYIIKIIELLRKLRFRLVF